MGGGFGDTEESWGLAVRMDVRVCVSEMFSFAASSWWVGGLVLSDPSSSCWTGLRPRIDSLCQLEGSRERTALIKMGSHQTPLRGRGVR